MITVKSLKTEEVGKVDRVHGFCVYFVFYHLGSCPKPDISVGGSAGSGYGWFGQSGSSSDGNKSTWHCSAGCDGRNPKHTQEDKIQTLRMRCKRSIKQLG